MATSAGANLTVSDVERARRQQVYAAGALLILLAAVLGPLAGMLSVSGKGFAVLAVVGLAVPVLFWKVRPSPVILAVISATLIERFPDPGADALTSKVPLWRSLQDTLGLSGATLTPLELLLILALVIWLARGVADRRIRLRASPLGIGVMVLLGISIAMDLFGLARGGVFNISLWELRPFLYLGITYLLASQLTSKRAALEAILWGIVIGTGLKGLEGTERVFTVVIPAATRPDSILEHDESVFFSIFVALTVMLWIYGKRGWLRRVATFLAPFVLVADFGNNRRAAWVMLPAMLLTIAVVAYVRMPERRKTLAWVVGVLLALSSAYVLAFHNSTSLEGEPAHAIWSQFNPDPRDYNSNLYRQLENSNLAIDIKATVFTGTGFGVPIAHPIPILDASNIDPLINFIPHNTILYVWLRLGTLGAIAFWFMVGAAIVAACRLARCPGRDYGVFGTLALTAVMAWLVEGYLDQGITSFRIATLIGCLLGAVAAAHRMAAREAEEEATAAGEPVTVRVVTYRVPRPERREPAAARSV
jgi:O-Antigen ligase